MSQDYRRHHCLSIGALRQHFALFYFADFVAQDGGALKLEFHPLLRQGMTLEHFYIYRRP